jgi:hypothetical protein
MLIFRTQKNELGYLLERRQEKLTIQTATNNRNMSIPASGLHITDPQAAFVRVE